jgi:hypothetical protein
MSSSKISLVLTPHKGIRYAFPQLSIKAGNIDYTDKTAVEDLKALLVEFGDLLEEHAHIENEFILKPLEVRLPGSTEHDTNDHERLYALQEELIAKLDSILDPAISPDEAQRTGYEFYQNLSELHAAHLEHMLEEERVTQTLMWQHFTQEEMLSLHQQIIRNIPPDKMLAWMKYILPALNPAERREMLGGMQAGAPAPFFERVMAVAERVLPFSDFEKLEDALAQKA